MIQYLVDKFIEKKEEIKKALFNNDLEDYIDILKIVISTITDVDNKNELQPDPLHITEISHKEYCGEKLFIIGTLGDESFDYFYTIVEYGSCSVCDTLESIKISSDSIRPWSSEQINEFYMLALHLIQKLKILNRNEEE